jgi:hypothetical protein
MRQLVYIGTAASKFDFQTFFPPSRGARNPLGTRVTLNDIIFCEGQNIQTSLP